MDDDGVSHLQYGVYLIPPPELVAPLRAAQELMSAQFGTQIATRFMVHCTIKGFFKLVDGASPTDFTPALDALYASTRAFQAEFERLWLSPPRPSGASLLQMLRNTDSLQHLHEQTWAAVAPFIATDCPFSHREPSGPSFAPHVTLVQADLPNEPGLREQGYALGQYLYDRLPTHAFAARSMQLVEFSSDDWYGTWSPSMRWRLLKGWTLASQEALRG